MYYDDENVAEVIDVFDPNPRPETDPQPAPETDPQPDTPEIPKPDRKD